MALTDATSPDHCELQFLPSGSMGPNYNKDRCLACDRELPIYAFPAAEPWSVLQWMCIKCHSTSGYSQPDEVADLFLFATKARVEAAKYEELPSDRLPPSVRLRELTNDDGTSTLHGFYHPRCPLNTNDDKNPECLQDNISSVLGLLRHLRLFHPDQFQCTQCELETADLPCSAHSCPNRGHFVKLKSRGMGISLIKDLLLVDMYQAQEDRGEADRLARIAFELTGVHDPEKRRWNLLEEYAGGGLEHGDLIWFEIIGDEYTTDATRGSDFIQSDYRWDDSAWYKVRWEDFQCEVYSRSGLDYQMSKFHDLWELTYGSNMPPVVAREVLRLIQAYP